MTKDTDKNRIQELLDQNAMLQAEIFRLRRVLAENGITGYAVLPSNIKNAYEPDQGAGIKHEEITRRHVRFFFSFFWGREDVYSKRVVKKNGGDSSVILE